MKNIRISKLDGKRYLSLQLSKFQNDKFEKKNLVSFNHLNLRGFKKKIKFNKIPAKRKYYSK